MNAFIETRPARVGFALVPPLVAWAVQSLLWAQVKPSVWIFFYPAVFFSSLLGGRMSGLVATVVSTAIVWLAFVIPEGRFRTAVRGSGGGVSRDGRVFRGFQRPPAGSAR
jgi:uncharacterized membrane protein